MSPDLRISDAEREAAIDRLGRHAAEGRLTPAELEERGDAALAARTQADLDALFADLPAAAGDRSGSREGGRSRRRDGVSEHVRAFVLVNLMLVAIWALTGAGYFWPIWPILGWGIGLVSHVGGAGMCAPRSSRARRAASSSR